MSEKIREVIDNLNIQLYMDGANINHMKEAQAAGIVTGFTTNPTLMRNANVEDYAEFAKAAVKAIPDRSISFEVFSDDFQSMEREARIIDDWGLNTAVKIPITNTKGDSSIPLIEKLSADGMKLNITAILQLNRLCLCQRLLT